MKRLFMSCFKKLKHVALVRLLSRFRWLNSVMLALLEEWQLQSLIVPIKITRWTNDLIQYKSALNNPLCMVSGLWTTYLGDNGTKTLCWHCHWRGQHRWKDYWMKKSYFHTADSVHEKQWKFQFNPTCVCVFIQVWLCMNTQNMLSSKKALFASWEWNKVAYLDLRETTWHMSSWGMNY